MTTHVAWLAVAVVVVDQLYTVLCAWPRTWVAQTLVDVSLTAWPHEASRTATLKTSNLIHAGAIVMTSSRHTVVYVYLTNYTQRSCNEQTV